MTTTTALPIYGPQYVALSEMTVTGATLTVGDFIRLYGTPPIFVRVDKALKRGVYMVDVPDVANPPRNRRERRHGRH